MSHLEDAIARAKDAHAVKNQAAIDRRRTKLSEGRALLDEQVGPIFNKTATDVDALDFQSEIVNSKDRYPLEEAGIYFQLQANRSPNQHGSYKSDWIGFISDGKEIWACSCGSHIDDPFPSALQKVEEDEIVANFSRRLKEARQKILAGVSDRAVND